MIVRHSLVGSLFPEEHWWMAREGAEEEVVVVVMPFNRFRTPDGAQVHTVLGPEMKSTG